MIHRYVRVVAVLGLGLSLWLPTGCSDTSRLLDEKNPWFSKATQLLKENKYQEAAETFEKCLRASPDSAQAHLQLGILYEDHLGDPLAAVYHYRAFLAKRPAADNANLVRGWLARAEETYMRELAGNNPDLIRAMDVNGVAREKSLAAKIRQQNDEILALKQERQILGGVPAASRPPSRAPAPSPPAAAASGVGSSEQRGPAQRVMPIKFHTVRPGETLFRISADTYGSAKYWMLIRDFNQELLKGRDELMPGMKLKIPPCPATGKPAPSAAGNTVARSAAAGRR
jgi:tetratricopeptide (TPR) repeat protein